MRLIHATPPSRNPDLAVILLRVDRITLAKRLWRGTAADGTEFGFELTAPLKHAQAFHETATHVYVVDQQPEPVVEISLAVTPSAAAGIGWAIGNLHLELSAEPTRLLAPDEPAVRQLLERLQVPFARTSAIFRPGHFARGDKAAAHDLGPSHRH